MFNDLTAPGDVSQAGDGTDYSAVTFRDLCANIGRRDSLSTRASNTGGLLHLISGPSRHVQVMSLRILLIEFFFSHPARCSTFYWHATRSESKFTQCVEEGQCLGSAIRAGTQVSNLIDDL